MMSTVSGNILVSYSFRSAQTDVPDSNEKIKDIQDSRELQYPDLTAFPFIGRKEPVLRFLNFYCRRHSKTNLLSQRNLSK